MTTDSIVIYVVTILLLHGLICIYIYNYILSAENQPHTLVAVTPTRFPDHSSGGEKPEAAEVLPVLCPSMETSTQEKGEQFEDISDKV